MLVSHRLSAGPLLLNGSHRCSLLALAFLEHLLCARLCTELLTWVFFAPPFSLQEAGRLIMLIFQMERPRPGGVSEASQSTQSKWELGVLWPQCPAAHPWGFGSCLHLSTLLACFPGAAALRLRAPLLN